MLSCVFMEEQSEPNKRRQSLKAYAREDLQGRKKLGAGKSMGMDAWPEWWNNMPQAQLLFTRETEDAIEKRLIEPLEEAARKRGIELWYTVRDYPLHLTLLHEGTYGPRDEGFRERAEKLVDQKNSGSPLRKLGEKLKGVHFPGEYLVTDGNSVMLTSSHIPPEIEAYRDEAGKIFSEHAFTPVKKQQVFVTVARIKSLPADEKQKQAALRGFRDDLIRIRHSIAPQLEGEAVPRGAGTPIDLSIEKVHTGMSIQDKKREEA